MKKKRTKTPRKNKHKSKEKQLCYNGNISGFENYNGDPKDLTYTFYVKDPNATKK